MKYVIELTDKQKQNLLLFLSRVDMKGSEAVAWVELVQLINGTNANGVSANGGANNGDD